MVSSIGHFKMCGDCPRLAHLPLVLEVLGSILLAARKSSVSEHAFLKLGPSSLVAISQRKPQPNGYSPKIPVLDILIIQQGWIKTSWENPKEKA